MNKTAIKLQKIKIGYCGWHFGFFISIIFFLGFVQPSIGYSKILNQLEANEYQYERIRVFFDTQGKNAAIPTDRDLNGIPDQVEDIVLQIWSAYLFFCKLHQYPDFFQSPRYPNLDEIEVVILHKQYMKGLNGQAFDELMDSRSQAANQNRKAIRINIANTVDPSRNLTPAHELFHLIQNGASYFKNPWYTEGLARWSEEAFADASLADLSVFTDKKEWLKRIDKKKLFSQSYQSANSFWNNIAKFDKQIYAGNKKVLNTLRSLRYKQGSPVLKKETLLGISMMRLILFELSKLDEVAFREQGLTRWSETNQRSVNNNPYIFQAVVNVLDSFEDKQREK